MKKFTAAVAQIAPCFLDSKETLSRCRKRILEAAQGGAELIMFPEVIVPGYPYWAMRMSPMATNALHTRLFREAFEVKGPEIKEIREAAREAGIFTVMARTFPCIRPSWVGWAA